MKGYILKSYFVDLVFQNKLITFLFSLFCLILYYIIYFKKGKDD